MHIFAPSTCDESVPGTVQPVELWSFKKRFSWHKSDVEAHAPPAADIDDSFVAATELEIACAQSKDGPAQWWPNLAPEARQVLAVWCGPDGCPAMDCNCGSAPRQEWFTLSWFQALCTPQFEELHRRAHAGEFDAWASSSELLERVCLIILLDQLPRAIHFGTPSQFGADAKGRSVAREALADGRHEELPASLRMWLYFPYLHSESLGDQRKARAGLKRIARTTPGFELLRESADAHYDAVELFGRIPQRNTVLGRTTSATEGVYLKMNPTV